MATRARRAAAAEAAPVPAAAEEGAAKRSSLSEPLRKPHQVIDHAAVQLALPSCTAAQAIQLSQSAREATRQLEESESALDSLQLNLEESRRRRIGCLMKLPHAVRNMRIYIVADPMAQSTELFQVILTEIVELIARLHRHTASKENGVKSAKGAPDIVVAVPQNAPAKLALIVLHSYYFVLRHFVASAPKLTATHHAQFARVLSSGVVPWMNALSEKEPESVARWACFFFKIIDSPATVAKICPAMAPFSLVSAFLEGILRIVQLPSVATADAAAADTVLAAGLEAMRASYRENPSDALAPLTALAGMSRHQHFASETFSRATEMLCVCLLTTGDARGVLERVRGGVQRFPGGRPWSSRLSAHTEHYARASADSAAGDYIPLCSLVDVSGSERERLVLAEHEAAMLYCPPALSVIVQQTQNDDGILVALRVHAAEQMSRADLADLANVDLSGAPVAGLFAAARLADVVAATGLSDDASRLLSTLCDAVAASKDVPEPMKSVETAMARVLEALSCVFSWQFSRAISLLDDASALLGASDATAVPTERRAAVIAHAAMARALIILRIRSAMAVPPEHTAAFSALAEQLAAIDVKASGAAAGRAILTGNFLRRSMNVELLTIAANVVAAAANCLSGDATAAMTHSDKSVLEVSRLMRTMNSVDGPGRFVATRARGGHAILLWDLFAQAVRAEIYELIGQAEFASMALDHCCESAVGLQPLGASAPIATFFGLPRRRMLLRRMQVARAAELDDDADLSAFPADFAARCAIENVDVFVAQREWSAASEALEAAAALVGAENELEPPPPVKRGTRKVATKIPVLPLERRVVVNMLRIRAAFLAAQQGDVDRAQRMYASYGGDSDDAIMAEAELSLSVRLRDSAAPTVIGGGQTAAKNSDSNDDDVAERLRGLRLREYHTMAPYRLAPLLRMETAAAALAAGRAQGEMAAVVAGMRPGIAHRRQMLTVLERRASAQDATAAALRDLYRQEAQFVSAEDLSGTLPENLSVCAVDVDIDPLTDAEALVLTRLESGAAPVTVRLPTRHRGPPGGVRSIMARLADIVRRSDETIARSFQATPATNEERRAWWATRDVLDAQLGRLCSDLQSVLGGFRVLLQGVRVDDDDDRPDVRGVQSAVNTAVAALKGSRVSAVSMQLCALFAELGPDATDRELRDVLSAFAPGFDDDEYSRVLPDFTASFTRAVSTASTEEAPLRHHVVLVLDRHVQRFPWESLPCLSVSSVSRLPTLAFLRDRLSLHSDGVAEADGQSAYYVINASRDLGETQTRLEPSLVRCGFVGVAGRPPTQDEWMRAVTMHDVFLYMSHGSGMQYVRYEKLLAPNQSAEKGRQAAVAVLMGCQSGHLRDQGEFDPAGDALYYLYAGSPAVVGTLWDVTSIDIDMFTAEMLRLWGLVPDEEGERDECMLTVAVAEARVVCRYKYLNAGAVVVYGLPVILSRRD